MTRKLSLTAALLAVSIRSVSAQAPSLSLASTALTPARAASSVGRPLLGAIAGGAAGLLVGGLAGMYIGDNHCASEGNPDSCYTIAGAFGGAAVGVTLGTPLGAHFMNHRKGNLTYSLLTSTGIAVAGAIAIRQADIHVLGANRALVLNSLILGVPVLQVVSSTLIESRTSRR